MAYTAQNTQVAGPVIAAVQRVVGSVYDSLVMVMESNVRVRQVEALQAMSDVELAERGLKREDIVRHVFQDMMHI